MDDLEDMWRMVDSRMYLLGHFVGIILLDIYKQNNRTFLFQLLQPVAPIGPAGQAPAEASRSLPGFSSPRYCSTVCHTYRFYWTSTCRPSRSASRSSCPTACCTFSPITGTSFRPSYSLITYYYSKRIAALCRWASIALFGSYGCHQPTLSYPTSWCWKAYQCPSSIQSLACAACKAKFTCPDLLMPPELLDFLATIPCLVPIKHLSVNTMLPYAITNVQEPYSFRINGELHHYSGASS